MGRKIFHELARKIYPNDPQKLTPPMAALKCSRPKRAGLKWIFFTELQPDLDHFSVLKSPHKFSSLMRESISKLPLGVSTFVGRLGTLYSQFRDEKKTSFFWTLSKRGGGGASTGIQMF